MAGTPVVVCPGFADQIANAMRAVTWHHVGWKQREKGGHVTEKPNGPFVEEMSSR